MDLHPLEFVYSSMGQVFVTTVLQQKVLQPDPSGAMQSVVTHDWASEDHGWDLPQFVARADDHRLSIKHSLLASTLFGERFAGPGAAMHGELLAKNGTLMLTFDPGPSTVIPLHTLLEAAGVSSLDVQMGTLSSKLAAISGGIGGTLRETGVTLSLHIDYDNTRWDCSGWRQCLFIDAPKVMYRCSVERIEINEGSRVTTTRGPSLTTKGVSAVTIKREGGIQINIVQGGRIVAMTLSSLLNSVRRILSTAGIGIVLIGLLIKHGAKVGLQFGKHSAQVVEEGDPAVLVSARTTTALLFSRAFVSTVVELSHWWFARSRMMMNPRV
jgi:hypothetical protein